MAIGSFEENVLTRLTTVEQRLDTYIAQGTSAGQTIDVRYIRLPTTVLDISSTGAGIGSTVELGAKASGNRAAIIDLHGDDTYSDYSARLARADTGANANTELDHRGTGALMLQAVDNGRVEVWINGSQLVRATSAYWNYAQPITVNAAALATAPVIDLGLVDANSGLHSLGTSKVAMYAGLRAIGGWLSGINPGVYVDLGGSNTGSLSYGLRFGAEGSGEGFGSARTGSTNVNGIDLYTNATVKWRVTNGGNLGAGTGIPTYRLQLDTDSAGKPGTNTWAVVSDPGTKRDAAPFTHGLADLLAFPEPETFFYNGQYGTPEDGIEYVGYMADKVEALAPKMVTVHHYTDPHTGAVTPIKHVNTGALTPMLHNAIRELAERLALVESKLA